MNQKVIQTFGRYRLKPILYHDLKLSPDFEATLILQRRQVIEQGGNARSVAVLLEQSLTELDNSITPENQVLHSHYTNLLERPDNSRPISVKVAENLEPESARYCDPKTDESSIIFQKAFIEESPGPVSLAIRLFHELGHTRFISLFQSWREEYELLKWDLMLYLVLKQLKGQVANMYPGHYRQLLDFLATRGELIDDLDQVINEVESLERESETVYRLRELYQIETSKNAPACNSRDARIDRAFKTCDPDFPGSTLSRVTRHKELHDTFLGQFIRVLGDRGIAQGRESSLYLVKKPVTIVPFCQLKNPRVPLDTKGVLVTDREKEKTRWARQYFPLHKERRFSDGIGITEAENGRGMEQRWHEHETTEQTVSLCDNTELIYGHVLSPAEDPTGKEIVSIESEGQPYDIVVDDQVRVPFGHMINMPPHFFHTLRNGSNERPSIDFTIKQPVTQLRKDFEPPSVAPAENIQIRQPRTEEESWGRLHRHAYDEYHSKLFLDERTGEMVYDFGDDGEEIPHSGEPRHLEATILEVDPGKTTENLSFRSLYPDLQVVRIFPWPREIPTDWVLDLHHKNLRAVVTVHDSNGAEIYKVDAEGGDLIVMDNSLASGRSIWKYQITNHSEHVLLLLVVQGNEAPKPAGRDRSEPLILDARSPVVV